METEQQGTSRGHVIWLSTAATQQLDALRRADKRMRAAEVEWLIEQETARRRDADTGTQAE